MNMARFYDDLPKLKHGDVPTFPVRYVTQPGVNPIQFHKTQLNKY